MAAVHTRWTVLLLGALALPALAQGIRFTTDFNDPDLVWLNRWADGSRAFLCLGRTLTGRVLPGQVLRDPAPPGQQQGKGACMFWAEEPDQGFVVPGSSDQYRATGRYTLLSTRVFWQMPDYQAHATVEAALIGARAANARTDVICRFPRGKNWEVGLLAVGQGPNGSHVCRVPNTAGETRYEVLYDHVTYLANDPARKQAELQRLWQEDQQQQRMAAEAQARAAAEAQQRAAAEAQQRAAAEAQQRAAAATAAAEQARRQAQASSSRPLDADREAPIKVTFFNQSGYVARYTIGIWQGQNDKPNPYQTVTLPTGQSRDFMFPGNTTDFEMKGESFGLGWSTLFHLGPRGGKTRAWDEWVLGQYPNFFQGDRRFCIKTWGTAISPQWGKC